MQSFRTELENPLVEKDIIDLEKKIQEFKEGKINSEKFRSLRLARGVYGQRQQGVQMIRIKLPFGKISPKQLLSIADISDEYSNGNLHLTTRQDIQIHYVSLDRTPELWARLEKDDVTLREACGNTVRNITASSEAGIDPNELFDVSPYAHAVFKYFLRKPFGQELGRKIKIAFSNNEKDSAFTYIHDIGFIPKLNLNGEPGFKILIGGGLGAQPFLAQTAFEFLAANKIIPFIEATLRVFDRQGERASRHKARLKYLINKIGVTQFLNLVKEEEKALLNKTFAIDITENYSQPKLKTELPELDFSINEKEFKLWFNTNVFEQKQKDYYGVYIKIQLGNISSVKARELARIAELFADDDIRITINQGILLRNLTKDTLPFLFRELSRLDIATPGFDSVGDITACPGTDTCNLAISNSTNISIALEEVIYGEFPELILNHDIKIKISGCMNSCGQHGLAQIGFHGSSFKVGTAVVPALQVLLGGGTVGNGVGRISDKIIKVASKRAPDVLRTLFKDFENNAVEGEYFNSYYDKQGKDYFYQLLKPIGDNSALTTDEFFDWGQQEKFATAIGVGECAGVVIDLVSTLFFEADEKIAWSAEAFENKQWGDSIYYSYAAFINAAKGLLLDSGVHVNTQHNLISDFDKTFVETGLIKLETEFKELILQINKHEPTKAFAENYFSQAAHFVSEVKMFRASQILETSSK